jgi:hypothetical protein
MHIVIGEIFVIVNIELFVGVLDQTESVVFYVADANMDRTGSTSFSEG